MGEVDVMSKSLDCCCMDPFANGEEDLNPS